MDDHLRIGDADRERAAADLAEHYAEGRLTAAEHTERLDWVWAARTRAELDPVFADLPGPAGPTRPQQVRRQSGRRPGPRFPLLLVAAVVVLLAVATHAVWLLLIPLVVFVLARRVRCGSTPGRRGLTAGS